MGADRSGLEPVYSYLHGDRRLDLCEAHRWCPVQEPQLWRWNMGRVARTLILPPTDRYRPPATPRPRPDDQVLASAEKREHRRAAPLEGGDSYVALPPPRQACHDLAR